MIKPLHVSLGENNFECLHCKVVYPLGMTHEEYFVKRRGKRVMRSIELDAEGFSRKWSGTYIAHDGEVIRNDGMGHPHITCNECGRVNVFGKAALYEEDDDGNEVVLQVLGRSESDLRYLERLEHGEGQLEGHRRMGGKEHPSEAPVAGELRSTGAEEQAAAGDGDRDQGA